MSSTAQGQKGPQVLVGGQVGIWCWWILQAEDLVKGACEGLELASHRGQ
jgi:hypothetical protein